MEADFRAIWTKIRVMFILAFSAVILSFAAVSLLDDGLTAIRGAEELRDYGVVAKTTDVRIHVSRNVRTSNSSGTSLNRSEFRLDGAEVVFTDPQGQTRSERLSTYRIVGVTPKAVGWTTQFEGRDSYIGKDVIFLPDQPGRAQMRDRMQSTLDHGYAPGPTYMGIGLTVLALLAWAGFANLAIGKLRSRRQALVEKPSISGIA